MPHYKDQSNKLHFIESDEFAHFLPSGCVQITDEEAEALRNPPPSLADLKASKRADLIAACESAIAAIRAGYPESEVLSWSKQEAEARALVADANAATPLLDALAAARNIDKAELAARVIAKADAFAAISGALIGKRQRLEDQLDALPADATPEQVAAIVW